MSKTQKPKMEDHIGLAKYYASQYLGHIKGGALTFDDLYNVALLALHNACEIFDDSRGVNFKYFAAIMMQRDIMHYINQNGSTIKKPINELKVFTETLNEAEFDYFDESAGEIESKEKEKELVEKIKLLTIKEQLVIRLYYGLNELPPMNKTNIGKYMKISKVRVGQLIESATKKLRILLL